MHMVGQMVLTKPQVPRNGVIVSEEFEPPHPDAIFAFVDTSNRNHIVVWWRVP